MSPDVNSSRRTTGVVVLGATGSIGDAAADVLAEGADRFRVDRPRGRATGRGAAGAWAPPRCAGHRPGGRGGGRGPPPPPRSGRPRAACRVARVCSPSWPRTASESWSRAPRAPPASRRASTCVRRGLRLALANKESMVVAGPLLLEEAKRTGAVIVPVDSEHCALFQCLHAGRPEEVRRLILTASGGPFRGKRAAELQNVTPAEALNHPTWDMGPRITVDSATLMNKALEVIEARWLFDTEADRIDVVVHPQSIVHSHGRVRRRVRRRADGPARHARARFATPSPGPSARRADAAHVRRHATTRTSPSRRPTGRPSPPWTSASRRPVAAAPRGAALNAADEAAVQRFLDGELPFPDIAPLCRAALEAHPFTADPTLDDLLRSTRGRAVKPRPTRPRPYVEPLFDLPAGRRPARSPWRSSASAS